jgi:hypothetical protein
VEDPGRPAHIACYWHESVPASEVETKKVPLTCTFTCARGRTRTCDPLLGRMDNLSLRVYNCGSSTSMPSGKAQLNTEFGLVLSPI